MNFYAVVTETIDNKHYAFVDTINDHENLKKNDTINKSETSSFTLCPTKKKALELAKFWNECYKNNGSYLFDYPLF